MFLSVYKKMSAKKSVFVVLLIFSLIFFISFSLALNINEDKLVNLGVSYDEKGSGGDTEDDCDKN